MQKNQRSRDFTVTQRFSDSFLLNQRAGVPRFRTAPLEPVRENHLASRRVAQKVAVVANSRVLRSSPHDEPATFIAWGGPQVHEYFRSGTPRWSGKQGSGSSAVNTAAPGSPRAPAPLPQTKSQATQVKREGTGNAPASFAGAITQLNVVSAEKLAGARNCLSGRIPRPLAPAPNSRTARRKQFRAKLHGRPRKRHFRKASSETPRCGCSESNCKSL